MEIALAVLGIGLFVFLAHLFSALFERTQIPDVLLLMALGLVIGPLFGWVTPEKFGAVGPVFTTVTLVIMLFEGGIELDLKVIGGAAQQTLMLSLSSFLVSTIVCGLIVRLLAGLPWLLSLMLGAAVGSTSPAVIVPLVRRLDISETSRTTLFLESAISDVISIVVALALMEAYLLGRIRVGEVLGNILASFVLAAIIGFTAALVWSLLLGRVRTLPNTNFTTLAFIFIVFGIVDILGYSGFIAALAFGITLGNIKSLNLKPLKRLIGQSPEDFNPKERSFFSEVVFLLKTFFFLYVGISIRLADLTSLLIASAVVAAIYIIRIPVVRLAIPASVPRQDTAFMAALVPKGLAAVVLASVPLQHMIAEGQTMQSLTYNIVLLSILVTSALVFLLGCTGLQRVYLRLMGGGPGQTERDRSDESLNQEGKDYGSL